MDHPLPWLRYVDADDLDDQTIDFDGLKVRNDRMETLGEVDGFIVDSESGRPYYVVVDSGGWFKSKHYLLPVGHARMDGDNDAIVVDLPKERIERFPGFDKDEFEKMGEDEIRALNDNICSACSTTTVTYSSSESYRSAWDRPQFAQPSWWSAMPQRPDRMGEGAVTAGVEYPPSKVARMTGETSADRTYVGEQVTARGADAGSFEVRHAEPISTETRSVDVPSRDETAASREAEDSPFFDGRAQPGDVIGLDTGGERTHIGETAEDENKRRRAAEEAAAKNTD